MAEKAEHFQSVFNREPTSALAKANLIKALRDWASWLMREQNFAVAADVFRRLLALKPSSPATLLNLGILAVRLERFGEASDYLKQAVAGRPGDIQALAYLAISERAQQKPYEQFLLQIIEYGPADLVKRRPIMAWAFLMLGLPERAFSTEGTGLNLISYEDLSTLYRRKDWPQKIQALPQLQGSFPAKTTRPLVFAAADDIYASTFAHKLISSTLANVPECDFHLHVMNPRAYDPTKALSAFPRERVSCPRKILEPVPRQFMRRGASFAYHNSCGTARGQSSLSTSIVSFKRTSFVRFRRISMLSFIGARMSVSSTCRFKEDFSPSPPALKISLISSPPIF